MAILDLQRRFHEVGRIRAGAKTERGAPKKLEQWRLTSANRAALEAASEVYGGDVRPWEDAPTPGQWELFTEVDSLDAVIPPTTEPYSLWYETWSGGGCDRRCDGIRDHLNDTPCACDPEKRTCKPTLRLSIMLTRVPGLGVWRYESHGWNAAVELPTMLDLLALGAKNGAFVPAVLRLEQRVSRKKGEGTRRFAVPVIDIQETAGDFTRTIASGEAIPPPASSPAAIEAPRRKALSAPADPPPLPEEIEAASTGAKASAAQKRLVFAKAKELGIDRDLVPRIYAMVIDTPGASLSDLLTDQVDRLVRSLVKVGEDIELAAAKIEEWETARNQNAENDSEWGQAPSLEGGNA